MTDGDSRVSGTVGGGCPSYWLDACEDISCDLIDNFVDFDTSIVQDSVDDTSNQDNLVNDFFGGIDHILDSIKNGTGLPTLADGNSINNGTSAIVGNGIQDCNIGEGLFKNEAVEFCTNGEKSSSLQLNGSNKNNFESKVLVVNFDNGSNPLDGRAEDRLNSLDNSVKENGNKGGLEGPRERDFDSEERYCKKARITSSYKNERQYSSRGQYDPRDRERSSNRKRLRDWDDIDRRDKYHNRRRDRYNGRRDGRDRDWRDREPRGYWERDRSGSNEMIFHSGSWEADHNKEGKESNDKDEECNGKPEKKSEETKEKFPEEQARQYQLDVLEQAKKRNTIAFLETGAGKTLIAVLLIKSLYNDLQRQNKKMLAVFLVPKVPLVYQQAEVIREHTSYQVGHYCGEMGQDFWDARRWQPEFESKQVLVMTAQILLNILRHSIIKMEAINLLILDECHHAVKKHPYSLVMSEFYHTTPKEKRPSVFGMTASPVNLKGVSSQVDCAIKIRNLESKLDSIVCTIKDRKELEKHVPMPAEIVVEYDKAASLWSLHEQIKQMEVAVEEAAQSSSRRSKWQFMGARDAGAKEELRQVYGVSERTESDGAANLIQKLRAINYALGELGQWCAYKVAQSFLMALQNDERANYQLDVKFQESYLEKVVSLLQCQLTEGAVTDKDTKSNDNENGVAQDGTDPDDIEEGELPDSHGGCSC